MRRFPIGLAFLAACACSSGAREGTPPRTATGRTESVAVTREEAPEAEAAGASRSERGVSTGDYGAADRDARAPALTTDPAAADLARILALAPSGSTSLGGPNNGALRGGVAFPEQTPGLRRNPRPPNPDGYYGTVELVQAVALAAASVARELAPAATVVNDASLAEGGPIPHHGSHQSGRDLDVLFYLLREDGSPFPSKGVPIDLEGRGIDFVDLADPRDDVPVRLDVPRTFSFLRALVEQPGSTLQRVFVVEHVRAMMLQHGRSTGTAAWVLERIGDMTCQPESPHDDHLHLRFFCTPEDTAAGCRDTAPIYPFWETHLGELGVTAQLFRGPRRRAPTTSRGAARAAALPMHADVIAFLERRETWARKPRIGRTYCR